MDAISLNFLELFFIGKYVEMRFKNWGSLCYFLSSRLQKIKNITKIEHTRLFLFTFLVLFLYDVSIILSKITYYGVRDYSLKKPKPCMQNLTKVRKQQLVNIPQQSIFNIIFIRCLWLRIIKSFNQVHEFSFTYIF